jgi:DNA repair exonuclease SbcCD ATPase subunit
MPDSKPISERVSVLETQMEAHASRLEENQVTSNKLIERLDAHMVASAERDANLQNNLTQVTLAVTHLSTTVEETNHTLKKIAGIVDEDNRAIRDWKMITKTVAKMISIMVALVIGAWAVFTFAYDRYESQPHDETHHIEQK